MEFRVDCKAITSVLNDIQGKGKYGISSSNLNDCIYITLEGNELELWNADSTLSLTITLAVEGVTDGDFVFDAKNLLPFLKKFDGYITFVGGDTLQVTLGMSQVTVPRIVSHSDINAITRIKGMLKHISYEEELETLWMFGNSKFEGAFELDSDVFKQTMGLCELIKSGIYRIDSNAVEVKISTQTSATNRYEEVVPVGTWIGEPATVEWGGPLHKFFNSKINFYIKDDFPLLLISEDRKLLRAPHIR
jgi:hypothetical protein